MISAYARNAIVLGLLAAIGPFAIDMYLPALPTIAADLNTTTAATQMTLMAFFVGFGLSQIVYGPASDMTGRKPPLYFGLSLFIVGAVGSGLSPSIGWLIGFRLIQGIGAASVMVVPRAVIRDLHTGVEATRLMATVMLVLSVSPILAPLAGSALIVPFGWRAVFVAATVAALLGFLLTAFVLPETWPAEQAGQGRAEKRAQRLWRPPSRPPFPRPHLHRRPRHASFFAFIASASFIYVNHFGLTPVEFSVAFSVNAIGFIGASQFSANLGARFGMARVVATAVSAFHLMSVLLFAVTLAGADSLSVLMVMLFLAFACLGLVIPATMVLSLEEHGPIAGMASALGGTLQMVAGGIMIVVVSLSFDGTALPMVTIIALSAVGALILTRLTLSREEMAAEPAE
jgi:DHA1 family bicyclomycin/chloramphenicol resistance-like MFS transporter